MGWVVARSANEGENEVRSVLFATNYSPFTVSGVTQFVLDMSTDFLNRGIDVALCYREEAKEADLPARVGRLRLWGIPTPLPVGLRTPSLLVRTAWYLFTRGSDFDICHVVVPQPMTAVAATAAKCLGRTTVATVFAPYPQKPNPLADWFQRAAERWTLRFSDVVVYECDATRRAFGKPTGSVIFSGIDAEHFRPDPLRRDTLRARLGIPNDAVVILFVGRITESKGVYDLAKAFSQFSEATGATARLLLVGSLEDSPKTLSRDPLREPGVQILGPMGKDEVRDLYQLADIFALPSYQEGVSSALIEAMACGLPAVVSAVGGNPEVVVDGECGYLHPPGDVAALRDRLMRLVTSADVRIAMGRKARERVVSYFEVRGMARRYLEVYRGMEIKST